MRTAKASRAGDSPRLSVTERARRAQIVAATIEVLATQGSGNATFARIARQGGLSSPGLISYHFTNKDELLEETITSISSKRMANVKAAIEDAATVTDELSRTLEADLAYMGGQPKLFAAIVEAFYTLRNPAGQIKQLGAEQQAMLTHLVDILKRGQRSGEFGEFDADNLGLLIHGALTQFLGQQFRRPDFNLTRFTETLVTFAVQAAQKGIR